MAIRIKQLSSHTGALILLLIGLLAPAGVSAQEAVVPLQFSFSDPGARSMGFGGAFVALADDATAAFANPAGLAQLLKPEVSIEGRRWSYSTPFIVGGRIEGGLPSGNGIDTTVGLRTATSQDDHTGLSFLSFVYPKENWSLAAFRHELANIEFSSETQGLFGGGTDCCQTRFADQQVRNDLEIVSYGLSVAYRISDKFDLGLGMVYYDVSFDSKATLFFADEDPQVNLFAPTSYLPERSLFSERLALDDSDWALTLGFLWRLSESWSVGGVYRSAPELDIQAELTAGEAIEFEVPPGGVLDQTSAMLELPKVYGLGIAYRSPDGHLTATFQWDRVKYSNIADSLDFDDQIIDDVNELHVGAEYVFLDSTPIIAVRLGTWWEPDHQIRSTSNEPPDNVLLQRGDDEIHYSAGVGVVLHGFQLDLGVDFADRVDTVSLSVIYGF